MNLLSTFVFFLRAPSGAGNAVVIAIAAIIGLIFLGIFLNYASIWMQALASGAHVGFSELIGMSLRHVDPRVIINSRIMALKAGIQVSTNMLEAHYLARGNVLNVVRALIAASRANIPLTFQKAAAIDLAGRNVLDAVQTSVNPKVIDCPAHNSHRSSNTMDAVAKDGIQLKAKARVTVRANLDRLVGGATEETIIARVGEGIVTTIGSAENYKSVLENPVRISKTVLQKGLDSGTAFEILSIDIADIDVGINIGAQLQADQAEADKKIAQAKAEERRAMAVALEQEKLAEIQANQAKVVLAEAEIPKAIAEAFNEGKISLMDYYKLRNVMADTSMRSAIAGDNNSTFKV